jgi:beta-xylosidase
VYITKNYRATISKFLNNNHIFTTNTFKMKTHIKNTLVVFFSFCTVTIYAQLWNADNGDGTYKNPLLHLDYSDPDAIRVGNDYYMVASSFTCEPGIPILHSTDLIHWKIINHVYAKLPHQRYDYPQHGMGSWAPSIRHHAGKYYVYFCTPEEGLFVGITDHPSHKWALHHVVDVQKWEDPCPFWDSDGKAYLVRGAVGAGPCYIHRMSDDGLKILDNGVLVFEDLVKQPVLEGFKFMDKRNGYYYISTPAGSVPQGWQTILRSKNIYGPYEDKIILHKGTTNTNGPHQGAFVTDIENNMWFLHFQDKGIYGRIVHMQPAGWKDDWPTAGIDIDGDDIGEPVATYKKPATKLPSTFDPLQYSDDFGGKKLKLIWQWHANPQKKWYKLTSGKLNLYTMPAPGDNGSLFFMGNLLLQKLMSPTFTATTTLQSHFKNIGDRAGLTMMGNEYSTLVLEKTVSGNKLVLYTAKRENRRWLMPVKQHEIDYKSDKVILQINLLDDQSCSYSYSADGKNFISIPGKYKIQQGTWIGAKVGIYALSANINVDITSYAAFDDFEVK